MRVLLEKKGVRIETSVPAQVTQLRAEGWKVVKPDSSSFESEKVRVSRSKTVKSLKDEGEIL